MCKGVEWINICMVVAPRMCQNMLILNPANLLEVAEVNPVKLNSVFFYVTFNRFWITPLCFIFDINNFQSHLRSLYTF